MIINHLSCVARRGLRVAFVVVSSVVSIIAAGPGSSFPTAPSFTVRDINNRLVSTDSLLARGPLIIDFWATCCVPCRAEFRAITKLVKKYGDKKITVLAVSEDGPSESAKVKQMVATNKWPFIVVMDNGRSIAQKFNVTAMPSLFLIGKDGKVRLTSRGYVTGDEIKLEKELHAVIDVK